MTRIIIINDYVVIAEKHSVQTLKSSPQYPGHDDGPESSVVTLEQVDDPMEPEGDEPPAEPGAEQHSLRAEAVAQVAAEHLGEGVAPEEGGQHRAGLRLRPPERCRSGRRHQRHRRPAGIQGRRPSQQGEKPRVLLAPGTQTHT